ncbi:hypothetical protein AAF712_012214 [Marasmius tenuissimus]|uniref:DNA 3'-5' helicase n=1 Tax=Marasmius tenuissimus TaxID=585030 RepID=A0ABR2ZHZ3_9AGAR
MPTKPTAQSASSAEPAEPDLSQLTLCPDSTELYTHPVLESYNLAINSRLMLFICLACKNAQTKTSVLTHFDKGSHDVSLASADRAAISDLANTVGIPSKFPNLQSAMPVHQFEGLEAPEKSSSCKHCEMTCIHSKMRRHIKDKHPEERPDDMIDCYGQRLNKGGSRIVIRVVPKECAADDNDSLMTSQPLLDAFLRDFNAQESELTVPKRDIPNARLISPFLMRFKWHLHVHEHNPEELVELVKFPSATDPLLWVKDIVLDYFNTSIKFLDTSVTHELVLMKLNSENPDAKGINNTPLHEFHQGEETSNRYSNVVVRLVVALLREVGTYRFPTLPELDKALSALRRKKGVRQLHTVLMLLWTTNWTNYEDLSKILDPTICFLVLVHLKPDGTFLGPKAVTGYVAQLSWAICMVILLEIHMGLAEKKQRYEDQMHAMDTLQQYVVDKQLTTFGSLRTITHFASAIVYSSMSDANINFTNTKTWRDLEFKGQPCTMDDLTECFKLMEEDLVELIGELMFGKDLRASYGTLHEDLSNTSDGFGVITNPANFLYQHDRTLLKTITTDPELRNKWFFQVAGTGEWRLNALQCRKYLLTLARAEGLLMTLIEMTSGAPPRITEITSMLVCNTPYRTRNMMIVGDALAMVRMYDKTTNLMQQDRQIPHALAGLVSDVFIQVHVLMRPFARWISLKLYPTDATPYWTYRDYAFAGFLKPFTGDDVYKIMTKCTERVCKWGIGPRAHREINIAFRRMLCPKATSLIEVEAGMALGAAQAGHHLSTENRIYANSNKSLISLREDQHYAFMPLTRQFQLLAKVPPSGLDIKDYRQLRMDRFDELESSGAFSSDLLKNEKDKVDKKLDKLMEQLVKQEEKFSNILERLLDKIDQLEKKLESQGAEHVRSVEREPVNTDHNKGKAREVFDKFGYLVIDDDDDDMDMPDQNPAMTPPIIEASPTIPLQPITGPSTPMSHNVRTSSEASVPNKGMQVKAGTKFDQLGFILINEDDMPDQQTSVPPVIEASPTPTIPLQPMAGPSTGSATLIPAKRTPPAIRSSAETSQGIVTHPRIGNPLPPARYQLSQEVKNRLERLPHAASVYNLDSDHCPITALDVLQAMYGPNTDWRIKQQRDAVEALILLQQDVVVALGCGTGKTAVAVIPLILENGYTVIVLPLLSLMADWIHRLKGLQIGFEVFDGAAKVTGDHNLILVSADRIRGKPWEWLLKELNLKKKVLRIVVDEAHYYFTDLNFRKGAFADPYKLRVFPLQFVLMSASIPPPAVDFLKENFQLKNRLVLRSPALSPTISYHRIVCETRPQRRAAIDSIITASNPKPGDRYIVFTSYLDDGQKLAKDIGSPFYFAVPRLNADRTAVTPAQEKVHRDRQVKMLDEWRRGDSVNNLLIATPALGPGIDLPGVKIVFFYNPPSNIVSFYQGAERIRGVGSCVLLTPPNPSAERDPEEFDNLSGVKEMHQICFPSPEAPPICIRQQLSEFLDETPHSCNSTSCEPCSECHTFQKGSYMGVRYKEKKYNPVRGLPPVHMPVPETGLAQKRKLQDAFGASHEDARKRTFAHRAKLEDKFDRIYQLMETFGNVCGACAAAGVEQAQLHKEMSLCPTLQAIGWHNFLQMRRLVHYPYEMRQKPCFSCHIPSGGGDRLHRPFVRGSFDACNYLELVLPLTFYIWTHKDLLKRMAESFVVPEWADMKEFMEWFATNDKHYITQSLRILNWYAASVLNL